MAKIRNDFYFEELKNYIKEQKEVPYSKLKTQIDILDKKYLGETKKYAANAYLVAAILKKKGIIELKDGVIKYIGSDSPSKEEAKSISKKLEVGLFDGIEEVTTSEEVKEVEDFESDTFENAYIKFISAGILFSLKKELTLEDLEKKVKEGFGIDVKNIGEILQTDCEFTWYSYKVVNLRSENSWEILKKRYNPANYKKSVLLRINSMSSNDVKEFFSEVDGVSVEVVSKFRETDAIYNITITESVKSKRLFLRFIRLFRKDDLILDKKIKGYFDNLLNEEEERAYKYYCPLEIELL